MHALPIYVSDELNGWTELINNRVDLSAPGF